MEPVNSLAELKQLSIELQSLLLLKQLMRISMQSPGGLNKQNLLLQNDAYQLADGFSGAENLKVRQFLLGGPWNFLANKGLIIDAAGNGFFYPAEEVIDEYQRTHSVDKLIPMPSQTSRSIAPSNAAGEGAALFRRVATLIHVLIASPSDVQEERDTVEAVVHAWNNAHMNYTGIMLVPIRWESHSYPASGERPQATINRQIVDAGDILVGIFGARLGTPTGQAQSGTIEEIERFRKAGKYVALYFSTADVPRTTDRTQLDALENYRKERQRDTLYATFSTPQELRDQLTAHLPKIVQEVYARIQAAESGQALMEEAETIRITADSRLAQVVNDQAILIADIISELEDNLAALVKPNVGSTFRKPGSSAWKQNRNKVVLPDALRAEVTKTYQTIDAWADIVGPGLHPGMGSMELNTIFASLPFTLTPLIERLRQFIKQ